VSTLFEKKEKMTHRRNPTRAFFREAVLLAESAPDTSVEYVDSLQQGLLAAKKELSRQRGNN
jgi:hypothetical protein